MRKDLQVYVWKYVIFFKKDKYFFLFLRILIDQ